MKNFLIYIKKIRYSIVVNHSHSFDYQYLMVQPILFPITGDSSSWLDFGGSYIGAVLSSAIAVYILYKQNQQNHIENIANRKIQLSVIKYNQELDKLRDLRTALVAFRASFDYIEITNIAYKFVDGHFGEEERMRLIYLVSDIDEKELNVTLLIDLMPKSDSIKKFNSIYNKLYNSYCLILGDFSSFLDLMQDLPQTKAEKRTYIEERLSVWDTYDKQQKEMVLNKIPEFTPQKSISDIIKSHGNYENIEEEASDIVKERLLETIKDSSLKENLKKCIQDILSEEQYRIYAILSQT